MNYVIMKPFKSLEKFREIEQITFLQFKYSLDSFTPAMVRNITVLEQCMLYVIRNHVRLCMHSITSFYIPNVYHHHMITCRVHVFKTVQKL